MKYTNQMICLFSFLALSGLSTNAHGNPQSDQVGPSGKLPAISELRRPLTPQKTTTKYTMRNIKPSPYIDYKIVYVTPDPDINYTIRNVGREPRNSFRGQNNR